LITRTSKDMLVTGIIVLVLIMTLARQGLPSRAGHRAGDRRYRVMRNDLTLALRRFRLATCSRARSSRWMTWCLHHQQRQRQHPGSDGSGDGGADRRPR
jgi:hypothetical protein